MKTLTAVLMLMSCCAWANAGEAPIFKERSHWTISKNGVKVNYSQTACNYLSKDVLLNVYYDSGAGVFDWKKMANPDFKHNVLKAECDRLTKEMRLRGLMK